MEPEPGKYTAQFTDAQRANADFMKFASQYQKLPEFGDAAFAAYQKSEAAAKEIETLKAERQKAIDDAVAPYKAGIPEKPEEYPVPKASDASKFRELAAKLKLSKDQAKAIAEAYDAELTVLAQADASAYKKTTEEAEKELKESWGTDYEVKSEFFRRGIAALAKDAKEVSTLLERYGNDTFVVRLIADYGEMKSDKPIFGKSVRQMLTTKGVFNYPSMKKS